MQRLFSTLQKQAGWTAARNFHPRRHFAAFTQESITETRSAETFHESLERTQRQLLG
ncbi:MAG TPA: hypothetical protein VLK65_11370 [Vicinamibacteria bacterium]|nr:hypothetical protein [Vicinamibacteria bacterium]